MRKLFVAVVTVNTLIGTRQKIDDSNVQPEAQSVLRSIFVVTVDDDFSASILRALISIRA